MNKLEVRNVSLAFGDHQVLRDVSIHLKEGELVCLLGVSGGGKTTLFNVISGLLRPDEGQVFLDGEDVTGQPGRISYMLQKDLLLPYRTIEDNVALPLMLRGMKKKEARAQAAALFAQFGLEGTEKKWPGQLSGGMRQRAALIRTLALEPDLLLLDEPFSALDYQTRLSVCDDIYEIIKREEKTAILVTHDLSEAISAADEVLVLTSRPGRIRKKVPIHFDMEERTPMGARSAPEFQSYFNLIWKELNSHA